MSGLVILPIILPIAGPVVWPLFAAAATAAASSLGFAGVGVAQHVEAGVTEVTLDGVDCAEVADTLVESDALVFSKDNVTLTVSRDSSGRLAVKVAGKHRSKEELQLLGRDMIGRVMQQYAYHRIVTEMKTRNFNVVGEQVEEDGTVRLKVRVYQGE